MKKFVATLSIASLMTCMSAFAGQNYNYSQVPQTPTTQQTFYKEVPQVNNSGTLKGRVVTVPAGQEFSGVVTTPLDSSTLQLGQNVSLVLGTDFSYGDTLVAPAGSSVTGSVIEVSKAKFGTINGKLVVRFTQITTPYGIQIPISAVIKTNDNSGTLVGGTKTDVAKEYTKDIAVGTGIGALSGLVFGAIAGGSAGKAAAIGTAIGAGGGLVKSVANKGQDVIIPVNSTVELTLTQPITVNPSTYNSNY